jgi:hypothetical protein
MQISADKEHKWFHPDNMYCTVYFNGEKQTYVVTASEEDGFIERYKTQRGRFMTRTDGTHYTEKVHGEVRIEMCKPLGVTHDT